jgi:aerobic-type carbon monoxide dehydrogenase small subunit (CoxS/CutS family)
VIFNQGNETKKTMGLAGQPVSDVAAQAGQYIRYGCKKGECGTCEAMCNGQWIRPCVSKIPALADGEEYVVTIKAIKAKSTSSGKFFSVKSFFMGFYNNLVGMVGFVKQRRQARKNFDERMDIEKRITQKAEEKRLARLAEKNSKQ